MGAFFVVVPNTVRGFWQDGYIYTVNSGVATITGYNGSGGAIAIPSTLGVYPTVAIGNQAFSNKNTLTSVTIPNNITTIGYQAFRNCESMTAINVNATNINYTSVGGILYNKTVTTLIQCPGGKVGAVSIPGSVITIGDYAFEFCSSLTSVTIPNSVAIIEDYAFARCGSLTSVTIPNSVTTIGEGSFYYCSSLTSFTIGSSVTTIEDWTFDWCSNLTSITFLGLAAPTIVSDVYWILNTPGAIRGHAYAASNFPAPGQKWHNLTMGIHINRPPVIGTSSPTNVSINIPISLTWSIPINDTEGDLFNWTIECNNGQTNSSTGSSNGTKSLPLSGLAYSTTYKVWVNATDPTPTGSGLYTRKWYTFTTNQQPIFGSPTPSNGSTNNPLSLTWSIPINDTEGDLFNWTIECNNGQTNSSTGASNGTKSLSLTGLTYSTTYKVWVNATDPTGSGLYTRRWYTFKTKASGGGGDGGGGGSENQKPVADLSAGEPYQGFVNTEITFDGSKSSDSDGNITKWFWIFGDNTNGTGKTIQHTYSKAGTYTVILTVTDDDAATNTDTTTCVIRQQNRPPTTPIITGPINGTKNNIYTYTAYSTDEDNDTINYTFNWGDTHTNSSEFIPEDTVFTVNHSWAAAGRYDVTVTVTDNQTESSSKITVYIDALQTMGVGYLLDKNGDGIYDAFYSDASKQITTVQNKNGNYNIDSDGNGDWDYSYDATKGLTTYQEPITSGFDFVLLIGIIIVIVIICGIVVVLLRRKGYT